MPDLQPRQASPATVTPIGDERQDGCLQSERHDQAIHLYIREFITGEREGELRVQSMRGSEDSGDNNFKILL